MRAKVLVSLLALVSLGAGCKPSSTKATVGPLIADRYDATAPDGSALSCYVFAGESSKPSRLCGQGGPIAGYGGAFFEAVAPAADSKFLATVGSPLDPGSYILRPNGANSVDAWPLGVLGAHLWLGGGKLLFAIDGGKALKIRLIDPATRSERVLDPGPTTSEGFLPVRAPDDSGVLLVTRLGADDLILVRDPLANAELSVSEASDETLPGNRRLKKHVEEERLRGGVYKPSLGAFSWNGSDPLFEGSPLGPFTLVNARR